MEKITENWYNYKEIFRLTNKLLGKDNELPLPPTEDLSVLANEFNNFFVSKITKIMQDVAPNNIMDTFDDYLESAFQTTQRLTNFKLVTDQDILSILHAAPPKAYQLDLIPRYTVMLLPHTSWTQLTHQLHQEAFLKTYKTGSLQTTIEEDGLASGPMQL